MGLAPKQKNLRKIDETTLEYRGNKIYAFRWEWEEDNEKGKEITKKEVACHLFRIDSPNQPLNLGEMSDGGKFTAVSQAINEGKWLVDYYLEKEFSKLLKYKDMLPYKHLRLSERIDAYEKLLASPTGEGSGE